MVKNMEFTWIGNRAWEAQILRQWFSFQQYLTLEKSLENLPGYSLENEDECRNTYGSDDLYKLDKCINTTNEKSIISYSPKLQTDKNSKFYLFTISKRIHSILCNKFNCTKWLAKHSFPIIHELPLSTLRTSNKLFVLQTKHGSCGLTTFIGYSNGLSNICKNINTTSLRLTPYINGIIINGHVIVNPDTSIDIPDMSLQLVTPVIDGNIIRPLYGGNDFGLYTEYIPKNIRMNIRLLLMRIGKKLSSLGYAGIFGIDLIYDDKNNSVYILEINPRMQGSTGLLTLLEIYKGMLPSVVRLIINLLKFNGIDYTIPKNIYYNYDKLYQAQVIIRKDVPNNFDTENMLLVDQTDNAISYAPMSRYLAKVATKHFTISSDTINSIRY